MSNKGFTLIELMLSFFVTLLAITSVMSSFVMLQVFWREQNLQVAVQSNARLTLEKMIKQIRPGLEAQVLNDGNTLRVRLDPNRTDTPSDDIWCKYEFADNSITFMPNETSTSKVILENVQKNGVDSIFSINGRNMSILFRVWEPASAFQYRGAYMKSSTTLRNE